MNILTILIELCNYFIRFASTFDKMDVDDEC